MENTWALRHSVKTCLTLHSLSINFKPYFEKFETLPDSFVGGVSISNFIASERAAVKKFLHAISLGDGVSFIPRGIVGVLFLEGEIS